MPSSPLECGAALHDSDMDRVLSDIASKDLVQPLLDQQRPAIGAGDHVGPGQHRQQQRVRGCELRGKRTRVAGTSASTIAPEW